MKVNTFVSHLGRKWQKVDQQSKRFVICILESELAGLRPLVKNMIT